jgi:hypothetical protein
MMTDTTTPDATKPWYASRTIWASVLQVAVGVAVSAGLFSASAGGAVVSNAPDLIIGAVTIVLGGISLYGRVVATKAIAS